MKTLKRGEVIVAFPMSLQTSTEQWEKSLRIANGTTFANSKARSDWDDTNALCMAKARIIDPEAYYRGIDACAQVVNGVDPSTIFILAFPMPRSVFYKLAFAARLFRDGIAVKNRELAHKCVGIMMFYMSSDKDGYRPRYVESTAYYETKELLQRM